VVPGQEAFDLSPEKEVDSCEQDRRHEHKRNTVRR
jgi:hypothetical protein